MQAVRFLKIQKPKGRRFVISDIHGCAKTFKALLKQVRLSKKDHLYLLGDCINRGPGSAAVLDYILKLKRKGYSIYMLKGNHEDIVLKANRKGPESLLKVLKAYKSEDLAKGGVLIDSYRMMMEESYHYFELDEFYLVHAGFDFSKERPFEETKAMMYIKEFKPNKRLLEKKRVVLGHSPKNLDEIVNRIKSDRRKIHIDNGCINRKTAGQGNLVCLNLDGLGLSIQHNIEK